MLPPRTSIPAAVLAIGLMTGFGSAQWMNLNFTDTSAWKMDAIIPTGSTPFTFPDQIGRKAADFVFNGGGSVVWNFDQGAVIISSETSTGHFNRFHIGAKDGKRTTLTLTSGTPELPGLLCARGSLFDSFRLGETSSKSPGALIIDGGVRLQTGNIRGEGPAPTVRIVNGRLEVLSNTKGRRLGGIAVTLEPRGQLWLDDVGGVINSVSTFASYTGGTIVGVEGALVFTNGSAVAPATGTANLGTLITVTTIADPHADADNDGLPDHWEGQYALSTADGGSLDPDSGPNGDPDHDGLTNAEEFRLGGNPRINESGKPWRPRPTKAALLIVNAHPDDEGIFFGGCYPYYTQVKKLPVISLSMTSGDYELPSIVRETEFRNAAWTYGLRSQPIFARFKDNPTSTLQGTWDLWADALSGGRLRAARYVATMIRRYRPDVIVTHGAAGEYGHENHIATNVAVTDAWAMAADPSIDLESLPPWRAKKLYVHEWSANRLFHDRWETASPELGGKTPRALANAGLACQPSQGQPKVSTAYATGEVPAIWDAHPSELWGLYATTVGPDTTAPAFTVNGTTYSGWAKQDFLEHVEFDLDDDGLPDDWEALNAPLPGKINPHADADGDGIDDATEFVLGTSPIIPNQPPLSIDAAGKKIRFFSQTASGIGYAGMHRRYRIETSPDLAHWSEFWQGSAEGAWKVIDLPASVPGEPRFFRLVAILE